MKGSQAIVSLWAAEEVESLIAQGKRRDAIELSSKYRLVTPVSGAVVLESEADYQEAGLTEDEKMRIAARPSDADNSSIPAVPEPEMWMLLFVVLMGLLSTSLRRGMVQAWRR